MPKCLQLRCCRLWVFLEQLHDPEGLGRPVTGRAQSKHKHIPLPLPKEQ